MDNATQYAEDAMTKMLALAPSLEVFKLGLAEALKHAYMSGQIDGICAERKRWMHGAARVIQEARV